MRTHITILGVIFLVFSLIEFVVGFAMMMAVLGIGIFAAILAHLPMLGVLASGFGFFFGFFWLLTALPGFLAGWGLLNGRNWGRILGIVLCCLHLLQFPQGTIFAVYGLWVLLNEETRLLLT